MSKKKVHLVPHTHWDREWYFNTSRSTIYLIKQIKEVLEVLEDKPEFKSYVLDAQISIIEDYLEFYPEDKKRIERLVADKRLFVGPWYTQTDQLVISQESIVRNLFYGIEKAEELGHSFEVGYVPDAFGQGGNMPQIYRSFGIKNVIFWRGVADSTFSDTQFIWKGTDGSEVYTTIMRNGYHYGGENGIPEKDNDKVTYLKEFVGKLDSESNTDHIYFAYGHDQAPIRENLPELVNDFNELDNQRQYIMTDPESYFNEFVGNNRNNLNKLSGEFTQAKHSRIHKTIFSTRADMKQLNNSIENYLVNVLEPVLVIADSLGIEYPHTVLDKIWKLMFENAAHDSIGGCNSDSTNRDILHRYKVAGDLSTNLLEITLRTISEKIDFTNELNILTFNPLPYSHSGVVEVSAYVPNLDFSLKNSENHKEYDFVIEEFKELTEYVLKQTIQIDPSKEIYIPDKVYLVKLKVYLDNLDGLSYSSMYVDYKNNSSNTNKYEDDERYTIQNEKYQISLNEDNTIDILDKMSNKLYEKQLVIIDSGDDGDSYNFSKPRNDLEISSLDALRNTAKVSKNKINEKINYSFTMKVPYNLDERTKGKITSDLPIDIVVELPKGSETINFNIKVNNQVLSHKLSVQFDTGIASQFSFADHLYGPIKRPVRLDEMEIWQDEEWDEMPISIEPMQNYVALSEENATYSVITEGVREYEIVGEDYNIIQLTLFRTFGFMGKEDLLYRPGRASGETIVETPDAQLLGDIECSFGVFINSNLSIKNINLSKISKEFLTIIPSYQKSDFLNGRMIFSQKRQEKTLPLRYQLFEFDSENIGISAIKASKYDNNYIVRLYNPYFERTVNVPKELVNNDFVELDEKTKINKVKRLNHNHFTTIKFN